MACWQNCLVLRWKGSRGFCEVEVDISRGGFEKPVIVGLPDTAVKESIERVRSAIVNSGFKYPDAQSLVNLAPADVKKAGPAFDLPIALGMLACTGGLESEPSKTVMIAGSWRWTGGCGRSMAC